MFLCNLSYCVTTSVVYLFFVFVVFFSGLWLSGNQDNPAVGPSAVPPGPPHLSGNPHGLAHPSGHNPMLPGQPSHDPRAGQPGQPNPQQQWGPPQWQPPPVTGKQLQQVAFLLVLSNVATAHKHAHTHTHTHTHSRCVFTPIQSVSCLKELPTRKFAQLGITNRKCMSTCTAGPCKSTPVSH